MHARTAPHRLPSGGTTLIMGAFLGVAIIVMAAAAGSRQLPVQLPGVPDAVGAGQRALATWALGEYDLALYASGSAVDAPAAREEVEALRAIEDPLARAQRELGSWASLSMESAARVTVMTPTPEQARVAVLRHRTIADPLARAQAELGGAIAR
jgi:hypothetical protein